MPITSNTENIRKAGEYSAAYDNIQRYRVVREQQRNPAFAKQRAETAGANFDRDYQYVAGNSAGQSRVAYERNEVGRKNRFNEQRSGLRSRFVSTSESDYQSSASENLAELEAQYAVDIAYLQDESKYSTEAMTVLNAVRGLNGSMTSSETPMSHISQLASGDRRIMAKAMGRQDVINKRMTDNGASLADMETFAVKQGAIIGANTYSTADIKEMSSNPPDGTGGLWALSKGEVGKEGEERPFDIAVGGYDSPLVDSALQFDNSLINPEKAAKVHAEEAFEEAELETDGFTGVEFTTGIESEARKKNLAKAVTASYDDFKNGEGYSFASRNKAIVSDALESSGITADSVSPQEYLWLANGAYNQVRALRDLNTTNAITGTTIKIKSDEMEAHVGMTDTLDQMNTRAVSNPDSLGSTLQESYGSYASLSVISMVKGREKIRVLDGLDKDFKSGFEKKSGDEQFTFFALAVTDALMNTTYRLPTDQQEHSMNLISGLRNLIGAGRLDQEPMFAQMFDSLFNTYVQTYGVKYENEAKEAQRLLHEENTAIFMNGTQKITVRGQGDDNYAGIEGAISTGVQNTEKMMSLLKKYSGAGGAVNDLGMVGEGGVLNASGSNISILEMVMKNMSGSPESNPFAKEWVNSRDPVYTETRGGMTSMTEVGFAAATKAAAEEGNIFTINDYVSASLGDTQLGQDVALQIRKSPQLTALVKTMKTENLNAAMNTAMELSNLEYSSASDTMLENTLIPAHSRNGGGIGVADIIDLEPNTTVAGLNSATHSYFDGIMNRPDGYTMSEINEGVSDIAEVERLLTSDIESQVLLQAKYKSSSTFDHPKIKLNIDSLNRTLRSVKSLRMEMLRTRLRAQETHYGIRYGGKEGNLGGRMGNAEDQTARMKSIMTDNSELNFVQRIIDPDSAPQSIKVEGGEMSHLTRAETVTATEIGTAGTYAPSLQHIVFPEVVERDGKLVKLAGYDEATGKDEAKEYAIASGEFISFDNLGDAIEFSREYKRVWDAGYKQEVK